MIYKIEKRQKSKDTDKRWTDWYGSTAPEFRNKKSVKEFFNSRFEELNKTYKMWQSGFLMGDESYTFQYRVVDKNGKEVKY